MKIFRTILVDDEPPARKRLRALLTPFNEIELIREADNPFTCIDMVLTLKPDLLFLDIQMPGLNGFEMIRQIPSKYLPMIIFVTAYDQYALKAFESLSVDYLLKPIRSGDLEKAISKLNLLEHRFQYPESELPKGQMSQIEPGFLNRFVLKYGRKWEVVEEDEVIYFFAEEKYCYLRANGKDSVINFTLQELEEKLDPASFVRGHRSFILSRRQVRRLKSIGSGRLEIEMSDGTIVKSSRSYLQIIKNALA
jgi:two-component system LytT family response regulator